MINVETREEVEQRLEMWRDSMEKRCMRICRKKTEYLRFYAVKTSQDRGDGVIMHGEKVKRVDEFKYFGLTVQEDKGSDKEVQEDSGWMVSVEENNRNHLRKESNRKLERANT